MKKNEILIGMGVLIGVLWLTVFLLGVLEIINVIGGFVIILIFMILIISTTNKLIRKQ